MDPTRRHLLGRASALAAVIAGGPLLSCTSPTGKNCPAPVKNHQQQGQKGAQLFEISLAEWSLNRSLFSGEISNLDFPRVTREQYGLSAVEYVNSFFKDKATDWSYLSELRSRANDVGVANLLIMIDGEGQLAVNDRQARREAVHNHFRWIAAASFLGCHAIRVNAGGDGTPEEQRDHAADSLRQLADVGDDYNIDVIVENHGGISSNGAWLASVMKTADHPRVGTLPDFGNFRIQEGEWYDRYLGVEELMPYAKAVSAKTHDFDEAGNETNTDYRRMLTIVMEAGYRGHIGIEYEGGGLSQHDGILATRTLLETVRDEMVAAGVHR